MSKGLTVSARSQSSKLAAPGAWLLLLEIYDAAGAIRYRLVNNTEAVTFLGNSYGAAAFTIDGIDETLKGNLPLVTLTLYDPDLDLRLSLYNNAGWSGWEVRLRRVYFSDASTYIDSTIYQYFTIQEADRDDASITFSLGAPEPLNRRFPRDRYIASICRHRFQDGMCRYGLTAGSTTAYTSNRIRFRAEPRSIDVFNHVRIHLYRANMLIKVTGSSSNNGTYRVLSVAAIFDVVEGYAARLTVTSDYSIVEENSAFSDNITLTPVCDYSITTCRALRNDDRFGGSPGIAEGIYG